MFSVKALIPVLITVHILFGGLVLILFKNDRPARYWLYGCLSLAFGLSLTMFRGYAPIWVTHSLANVFTLYSWFLFFIGIELLLQKKTVILPWSLPAIALHGLIIQSFIWFDISSYIAIYLSIVWAVLSFYFYRAIKQFNRSIRNRYVQIMGGIYFLFALVWGIHALISWQLGLGLILDDQFFNWLTMLLNTLLALVRQLDYFAIRYSFMSNEKTQIEHLLAEREKMIASLLKANKTSTTGALSASIAHELNQPLGASNVNLQFMRRKLEKNELNPQLTSELLHDLQKDNDRAAAIVRSLRSMFMESNVSLVTADLSNLIERVTEIVRPELQAKEIQLTASIEQDLMINAYPGELEQVMLNLINNAIQAMTDPEIEDRKLWIDAKRLDSVVKLIISDSGKGVPQAFIPQLFELLTTTKEAGMGLGLWLCKYILTRHEGNIQYEAAPTGGARFIVELPVSKPKG